jgi:hypothetical protein
MAPTKCQVTRCVQYLEIEFTNYRLIYLGQILCLFLNRQKLGENLAFCAQTNASFLMIVTLVFEKKSQFFFAEKWRNSQKIVILTSTLGY